MAAGRRELAWQCTSALLAMLANCHRDPDTTSEYRPSDFDPTAPKPPPMPKVGVGILKDMFFSDGKDAP